MSTVTTLSTTDIEGNAKKLLELQHVPEERLQQMSQEGRRSVETHYTWEHFCSTVWRELEPYALG
jgi:glycosyltransferase involved in cell wall biosynthesis